MRFDFRRMVRRRHSGAAWRNAVPGLYFLLAGPFFVSQPGTFHRIVGAGWIVCGAVLLVEAVRQRRETGTWGKPRRPIYDEGVRWLDV